MKIYSVYDDEFTSFGKVLEGYDTKELMAAMETIPHPETGTAYEASIELFEKLPIFTELQERAYGGMPIELGMCWGYNTKLNCLEYHRDSELNIGSHDFILLLAKLDEIDDGMLDTAKVKAFRVPEKRSWEDRLIRARNKWLLAHPDSPEAKDGAYIGLTGVNIDMEGHL